MLVSDLYFNRSFTLARTEADSWSHGRRGTVTVVVMGSH